MENRRFSSRVVRGDGALCRVLKAFSVFLLFMSTVLVRVLPFLLIHAAVLASVGFFFVAVMVLLSFGQWIPPGL